MRSAGLSARTLGRQAPHLSLASLRLPMPGLRAVRNWRLLPKLALVMIALALAPLALVIGLNDFQTRDRVLTERRAQL